MQRLAHAYLFGVFVDVIYLITRLSTYPVKAFLFELVTVLFGHLYYLAPSFFRITGIAGEYD
ncbi:hypothetical protein [Shouchella clausii]|jgi:uncharacterized membrane protein YuzA (DUF378 family)|uniref:hypothetical protein n=1 Tax=Shouchella clausii TaxID=79880 RepID=UPI000B96AFE5|nr:hypothetical protein [Shouchella clausii]AST96269.1 hypothetical protein BC8716_10060 [Shouchella clausii]MCR1290183.1 hypothetical protein [Shouchella clausii]MEB5473534.1 hypothetical protein [Shouchella clausii]QNM42628.1 hypothetical protein DUT88_06910 [Shouchella clausii]WQG94519.1 hypothetical protein SR921_18530 [Shouchella clausii]